MMFPNKELSEKILLLFPEPPEQQGQESAQQQSGDDGKMKTEIALRICFGIVSGCRPFAD
ncbi:MAG TPA: hypothetical protein VN784_02905 [Candidatus Limnocylindrales bacterium]|nr:hypothetical protein [Candidatus Limnocylindrales bacterium]